MQDCSNSIADALDLLQSCAKAIDMSSCSEDQNISLQTTITRHNNVYSRDALITGLSRHELNGHESLSWRWKYCLPITFFSRQIVLKFCTQHYSVTKFKNDRATEKSLLSYKRDFARFVFKMRFGPASLRTAPNEPTSPNLVVTIKEMVRMVSCTGGPFTNMD